MQIFNFESKLNKNVKRLVHKNFQFQLKIE